MLTMLQIALLGRTRGRSQVTVLRALLGIRQDREA